MDKKACYFNEIWYLNRYEDVKLSGMNGWEHYTSYGMKEGRVPNQQAEIWKQSFDENEYIGKNPEIKSLITQLEITPFYHYVVSKNREQEEYNLDRKACCFDEIWYLNHYVDVRSAGMNGWEHYTSYGMKEGRVPNQQAEIWKQSFDENEYIGKNPEIKELVSQLEITPFYHYVVSKNIMIKWSYIVFKNKENVDHFMEKTEDSKNCLKEMKNWGFNENMIQRVNVYFISNIKTGGSKKYIDDLISTFENQCVKFHTIKNKKELEHTGKSVKSPDIIFFQHLLNTDIDVDDILLIKEKTNCKLITTIHDMYFLTQDLKNYSNNVHKIYLNPAVSINPDIRKLLNQADQVIGPSNFAINEINYRCPMANIVLSEHIDHMNTKFKNYVPSIGDDLTINICVPHELSEYKGKNYYFRLICEFSSITYLGENYKIKYHLFLPEKEIAFENLDHVVVHPLYKELELYNFLVEKNIHLITFLNKWGETFCYGLTKALNSGLPILYNNIGAFRDRIDKTNKFYFCVEPEINGKISFEDIISQFKKSLNFIINTRKNNDSGNRTNFNLITNVPSHYYNLMNETIKQYLETEFFQKKDLYDKLFKIVQPYAIYFPQFHDFPENDLNYYNGYTDMINLSACAPIIKTFKTPLNGLLGYYDLKHNQSVIDMQINLAKSHGIKGFAMYYYWFSTNTITDKHMIMKDVIDKFFIDKMDSFDVFFIFANESWSKNPAFSANEKGTIINELTDENIIKLSINLVDYFKHPNYRKINNKPVLLLHHPWELTVECLFSLKNILNTICIENGFEGIHFIINEISGSIDGLDGYFIHPNYKTSLPGVTEIKGGHPMINYDKYIDHVNQSEIVKRSTVKSCFPSFNNYPRLLYNKNRDSIFTSTEGNTSELFGKFISSQTNSYKLNNPDVDDINKIFLINSWNEWGEQMAIEPSNEEGFLLIKTLQKELLKLVS